MQSESTKRKSWQAVYDFGEYWEKKGKFRWFHQNIAIFPSRVTYSMKGTIRTIETTVHLVHEGNVELIENGWLNVDDHYTGFDADWQVLSLTPAHALRIEGSGPKVNGDYWVEILPS
jgi:hypothetical protein